MSTQPKNLSGRVFPDESPFPEWTSALPVNLVERLRHLPSEAIKILRGFGEHWHGTALSFANSMVNMRFSKGEIRDVLTTAGDIYSGDVQERDIERVIARAYDKNFEQRKSPKWPDYDAVLARRVVEKFPFQTIAELEERSSLEAQDPAQILETLFPGDPLLCLAVEPKEKCVTRKLSEWIGEGLADKNFIVPSPMSATTGKTKEGKPSGRCLDNTGERRYLVVESDEAELSKDEKAAIIGHLESLAPLVMVFGHRGQITSCLVQL